MAVIPGEADFSGIPSARSGRSIAREDVSARFAGAEAFGAGLRQAGASVVSIATDRARKQQELETFNTEAQFQRFNNAETQRYVNATRDVPPGGAAGFSNAYAAGYDERARSFMEGVPDHLRPQYDARLVQMRGNYEAQGHDFELNEQIRSTGQTLDDTLNNTILPRITAAAALPDAGAQQEALAQIIADGETLINANPYLSPIEKDAAIQAWRLRAQTAFVEGVPAEQRGEWLGTQPLSIVEQIIGVESGGDPTAANPNSSALGLGQFIESTWWDLVGAYRPDLIQGRSRDEVLALRTDPAISREMTERYIEQNAQHLASRGLPVTAGTIYLAHFLGPGGAQAVLSVPAGTPVSELLPAGVVAANRSILEGMTAGEVIAWADSRMAGAPTTRANRLDAIPYEDRNALAADAAAQAARDANARTAAANAENAARLNELLVGIHDGRLGASAVLAAREAGILTDFADIERVDRAMEDAYGEIGDIQAALGLLNDPNYTFNPFHPEDRDAVDLAFEEMGGVGALLSTQTGEEEDAARADAIGRTMAVVRRTGIVPESAMNALLGGMYSNDPAQMAAAFTVLDAIYRDNPRALTGPNGFNEEQQLRYDTYQTLAPMMTPEALVERMRPDLDPREAERRDRMIEEGRTLAAERTDADIVNEFIGGFWGAGEAALPEGTQMLALRDDYQTFFAERYAITGNADAAHIQALAALRQKWGVSDAGDTRRVMSYPPEQQFQPVQNSGADGYQWMRDSIRALVEAEVGPNPQAYWLVANDKTEAALGTGDPPYEIVAIDANGQIAVFTAGGLNADREAALAQAREAFEEGRAAAGDAVAAPMGERDRPEGGEATVIAPVGVRDREIPPDLTVAAPMGDRERNTAPALGAAPVIPQLGGVPRAWQTPEAWRLSHPTPRSRPAIPAAPTAQTVMGPNGPVTQPLIPPGATAQPRTFSTTPGVNQEADRLWRLAHPKRGTSKPRGTKEHTPLLGELPVRGEPGYRPPVSAPAAAVPAAKLLGGATGERPLTGLVSREDNVAPNGTPAQRRLAMNYADANPVNTIDDITPEIVAAEMLITNQTRGAVMRDFAERFGVPIEEINSRAK